MIISLCIKNHNNKEISRIHSYKLPRCRGQILSTLSVMTFFGGKEFFTRTLISKMALNRDLRITEIHAADPERGFLAKSISKSNGCAIAMPTAWELT